MKTIPPLLLADLKADCTTIAFIWSIELGNGRLILGTEHDLDITIPMVGDSSIDKYAGTYKAIASVTFGDVVSSSDMSVDNLDVTGAVPQAPYTAIPDITVDDIEAGLCDTAPVNVMICNWKAPDHGYFTVKAGTLGAITRDSDGKYTTEVRGLTQALSQAIIRLFSATCNVEKFGNKRCKFNVAAATITGTVVAETNRQQFSVDLDESSPPSGFSYDGGTLTFLTGANAGFFREVKIDPNTNGGIVQFWDDFPEDMAPGDAFTLSPGCDRQYLTCRDVYHNLVNSRMYGVFIPGLLALTSGPTTPTGMQ